MRVGNVMPTGMPHSSAVNSHNCTRSAPFVSTSKNRLLICCISLRVNASDIANVLVALGGEIITNEKTIAASDFFTTKLKAYDMLDRGELVTAVTVPDMTGWVTGYHKDRLRNAIDFALVSLAYAYKLENGRISDISLVFGGVAPVRP